MQELGKFLILTGVFLVIFGLVFTFWHQIPLLGKLPGDISINKGGFHFYFPLVSCLIISVVLSLITNVIIRLLK